ncbi:SOS response-associated peptidase [Alienimonas chondri]|uniref:Abasic site processing protein n=1 Tax=Alienimonas chondri TaxID=2681879 RepID=A0ABX1VIS9_9PLAN|nr:SOS response-associated peptidase [Alienimonas chondri]NNJ28033.1 putative SOS response-associated peptidase YedK [Alienimonas chondri]
MLPRMCGRFVLLNPPAEIVRQFRLPPELTGEPPLSEWEARYNVAPTQPVPVVREGEDGRTCDALRWGLIPSWAKDKSIGNRLINARSETAATKPSFRSAYVARRCLVPASGFYEWTKPEDGSAKVPHFFSQPGEPGASAPGGEEPHAPAPFGFAGLWERWTPRRKDDSGEPIETFTLLTGEAYPAVAPVHGRSPLIVPPDLYDAWLDLDLTDAKGVAKLLRDAQTRGGDGLVARPVSTAVNSPANDGPELIEPA